MHCAEGQAAPGSIVSVPRHSTHLHGGSVGMQCIAAEWVNYEGCLVQGLKEKKLVESNLEKVDRLKPIAKELDCSLAQLALAWCIRNEHVSSVITGATKREQVC